MNDPHGHNKAALAPLRAAQRDWDQGAIRAALDATFAPDAVLHLCHPFGDLTGPEAFNDTVLAPLVVAMPDLERRDWIVVAGADEDGADWVGCAGHFMGNFVAPLLDIPPTGQVAHIRFHEFYRFEGGRVVEMQAIWDLPELMMQANAWPMVPSLGREFCIPAPMTQDGLAEHARDAEQSAQTCKLIVDMLTAMTRHPKDGGPEVMEMERFWHPRMNWYGPAGIGTGRGITGFRNWHQIPFLKGMPDRGQYPDAVKHHFFAENAYAAVTGWPDMAQTISGDGFLGIAPAGQKITMRSLDFWRVEAGVIRENWVLVDLLDVYNQLGVDVFARLREFNKARVPGTVPFPYGEH
ncbi:nuclear transport factor 2 family protein [Thalassococcus lentus]|uniref:Ester cyclase n=1 Tax=Thalassococcus lentus TaxID=1210524 RepID=A0ABT4XPA5_9RHOB|nr:ester cyclase [Thalassococcus lentus]MDA7423703.1 ester cyclase [Thalassococcus lentus]